MHGYERFVVKEEISGPREPKVAIGAAKASWLAPNVTLAGT